MIQVAKAVILGVVLGIAGTVLLTACGGGGDGGSREAVAGEDTREAAQTAAIDTLQTILFVFETGFDDLAATEAVTLACPAGGSATLVGNIDLVSTDATSGAFSFAAEIRFAQCDGLGGTLEVSGSGTFDAERISASMTFDGTVANGCRVTFEPLEETIIVDVDTGALLAGEVSGALTADCAGTVVTCAWQRVDAFDSEAVAAGCR
ncbi:MAG: hypothetical protein KatS3mg131_3371 [Candidatus Tectimicrobiota bacterium]|nr:MAG: hypothetical protein KatS3mg131_3371 [Candidatus Tectomicrobia bacterium]